MFFVSSIVNQAESVWERLGNSYMAKLSAGALGSSSRSYIVLIIYSKIKSAVFETL